MGIGNEQIISRMEKVMMATMVINCVFKSLGQKEVRTVRMDGGDPKIPACLVSLISS